ncbi:hypothetical protein OAC86_01160 [bacterium]|nr:hypothetical protein [bacterium]MDB9900133.1 hypothetical protein [bacterium]
MKDYKTSRYPEGYMPKIEYYQAKLSIAVGTLSLGDIKFFTDKLEYFMDREQARQARLAELID